ncbi:PAS domain S-box protein [Cohnella rhizosphaerae]|uniref:histidine kinase n=1 Tax=Cohnella rhizosphaerae TaxID=1457232 RepID=A0A9X4KUR9_9BACL|nr:PAS domain S-box protein [Cohnella rhizosphaerae]MDG0811459.1 PAS domain S-box protein [Cohnella rhizosphaerae]
MDNAFKNSPLPYERLYDLSPVGTAFLSPDASVWIGANPSFCRMVGYGEEELQGIPYRRLAADAAGERERLLAPLLEGGLPGLALNETFTRKDGSSVAARLQLFPIRSEGVIRFIGVQAEEIVRAAPNDALSEEAILRLVLDHAQDLITVSTPDGITRYVSPAIRPLLGYEPDDLVGRNNMALYHPDDIRHLQSQTFRDADVFECRVRHRDGNYLWFETTFEVLRTAGGELDKIVGIGRDITARKKFEENLAEAQRLARIGSWDWEIAGGRFSCSDEMHRMFDGRIDRNRIDLDAFFACLHPGDRDRIQANLQKALQGGFHEADFRILTSNGDTRLIHARIQAIVRPDTGEVDRLLGTVQDITERRQMEAQLRESEQRYKSLFDYNPSGVYSFDLEGNFTSLNAGLEKLLGYTREELMPGSFVHLVYPPDLPRTQANFNRAAQGEPHNYEAVVIHKNGSLLDLNVTNVPIFVDERVVGVFGIAYDITERKRHLEQIQKLSDEHALILSSVSEGIFGVDREGRGIFLNPPGARMLGCEQELFAGRPYEESVHHTRADGSRYAEGKSPRSSDDPGRSAARGARGSVLADGRIELPRGLSRDADHRPRRDPRRRRRVAGHHERSRGAEGEGVGRARGPCQVGVSRDHEPRAADADERHHGHDRPAARHPALGDAARVRGHRHEEQPQPAAHPERHPRLQQDRGRQARSRMRARRPRPTARIRPRAVRGQSGREGHCARHAHRRRSPRRFRRRRGPHPASARQSGGQRDQIHRRRQRLRQAVPGARR